MTGSDPLDGTIREALTEVVDRSPIPPDYERLMHVEQQRSRRPVLVVAGGAVAATAAAAVVFSGGGGDTSVSTANEPTESGRTAEECRAIADSLFDVETDALVYLPADTPPAEIDRVTAEIDSLPYVDSITLNDREDVLDQFRRIMVDSALADSATAEIMPSIVEVAGSGDRTLQTLVGDLNGDGAVSNLLSRDDAVEENARTCIANADPTGTEIVTTSTAPPMTTIPPPTMEALNAVQEAVSDVLPQFSTTLSVGPEPSMANRILTFEFSGNSPGLEGQRLESLVLDVYATGTFDATELSGLETLPTQAPERAWLGADDSDLRSVYFLGTAGTAIRVASSAPDSASLLPVDELVAAAANLASHPAVISLARDLHG